MTTNHNDGALHAVAIRRLGARSVWRPLVDLSRTWLLLVTVTAASVASGSAVVVAVALPVVGALQYALLILMHDGQHALLHPSKGVSDFVSKWLIAAPCGASFEVSRHQHLAHHRHLGDPQRDPAFIFYCYDEPSPKSSPARLVWHFVQMLAVGRVLYSLLGRRRAGDGEGGGEPRNYLGPVLLAQALVFAVFWSVGSWWGYLVMWVLPLVTFASFYDAARQFAEHALAVPDAKAESRLFTVSSNPLDRFFFAPFNMNFHAEHHLYPYVPYYRLPELRRLIEASPEGAKLLRRSSYAGFLAEFLAQVRQPASAGSK